MASLCVFLAALLALTCTFVQGTGYVPSRTRSKIRTQGNQRSGIVNLSAQQRQAILSARAQARPVVANPQSRVAALQRIITAQARIAAQRAIAARLAGVPAPSPFIPKPRAEPNPNPPPGPNPLPPVIGPTGTTSAPLTVIGSCPNAVLPQSCDGSQSCQTAQCLAYPAANCRLDVCNQCRAQFFVQDVAVCCDLCPNGYAPVPGTTPCALRLCPEGFYCSANYCTLPASTTPIAECLPRCRDNNGNLIGDGRRPHCLVDSCLGRQCPLGQVCRSDPCTCLASCSFALNPNPSPPSFNPNPVPYINGNTGGSKY